MTTYAMTRMLTRVKMLLNRVDSLTPTASNAVGNHEPEYRILYSSFHEKLPYELTHIKHVQTTNKIIITMFRPTVIDYQLIYTMYQSICDTTLSVHSYL